MPQTLQVKVMTRSGEEALRQVKILRTFCHAGGAQVFLHTNGVYGYKDGAPVRSKSELDIIGHPLHRKAAQMWWDRIGQKMSEDYYAAQQERERARIGDFQHQSGGDNTEFDAAMYYRNPTVADAGDVEGPFTWMDIFPSRPDWWGQATVIQFQDYLYSMAGAEETLPLPTPDPQTNATPIVTAEEAAAEANRNAEAAEEDARQKLMAEIKARFPDAVIHPATGMKKLQEKYLELQEAEEERAAADQTDTKPNEFE